MNRTDDFLGGRVDNVEGLAVDAFDEFVVDEASEKTVSFSLAG